MKTFKNKNFTKRDYETTNVVFCKAYAAPNENWIECGSWENKCLPLSTETVNGKTVHYYGYL